MKRLAPAERARAWQAIETSPEPMEATKKIPAVPPEILSLEAVQRRVPLLRRIVRDVVECFETRRKSKEFLEELIIISRKFSSSEIEETMNSLRRSIAEADRMYESLEKEIAGLGGKLRDPSRGLTYFYSERDSRRIFLIWDLREPDLLTWHELDETFSDRLPVDFSESGGTGFPKQPPGFPKQPPPPPPPKQPPPPPKQPPEGPPKQPPQGGRRQEPSTP